MLNLQLAPYWPRRDFTAVRNAQMAALKLPNTGYAVAIDLGDVHSPVTPIHPRRKQEVGRRLALSALSIQYGNKSVISTGPVFHSVQPVASAGAGGGAGGAATETAAISFTPGTATISFTPGTATGRHNIKF